MAASSSDRLSGKRALIVKLGAIGDVIATVPAVRALFDSGYEIHWICGKAARPLLESYSWIHIIAVDDAAILKGTTAQRLRHIVGLWRRIAGTHWDVCATLYYDRRYRILTLPVRANRRVALSSESRERNIVAVRSYSDEFARILLDLPDECRPRGFSPLRPDRLPPPPLPASKSKRRIAVVPGGTSNLIAQQILRRWPIENFVAVAAECRRREWEVVLLGGPGDEWVRPHFENIAVTDCIAMFSLPEVISLCDTCDGVISHDTGPMHLAGLSDTCLIAIFGPSNPGHVLPRRAGVLAIWGGQEYACRPCYDLRTYAPCPSAGCMREVTPELVMEQLDRLLANRSHGIIKPWDVIFAPARPNGQQASDCSQ
jgi:heptosyltransferase-2